MASLHCARLMDKVLLGSREEERKDSWNVWEIEALKPGDQIEVGSKWEVKVWGVFLVGGCPSLHNGLFMKVCWNEDDMTHVIISWIQMGTVTKWRLPCLFLLNIKISQLLLDIILLFLMLWHSSPLEVTFAETSRWANYLPLRWLLWTRLSSLPFYHILSGKKSQSSFWTVTIRLSIESRFVEI